MLDPPQSASGALSCAAIQSRCGWDDRLWLAWREIAKSVAGAKPVLMTVCESSTKRGMEAAKADRIDEARAIYRWFRPLLECERRAAL